MNWVNCISGNLKNLKTDNPINKIPDTIDNILNTISLAIYLNIKLI